MAETNLRFQVLEDAAGMSAAAAAIIVAALKRTPDLLLCASAGGTPTGTYHQLARIGARQPRLFTRMRVLQIDEWGGLDAASPFSCAADLREKLLRPLGIARKSYFGFHTNAPDPEAECARVSRWLAANGPIDICLLGLGLNGHIAMNEPGLAAMSQAHVAKLAPSSQQHPMLAQLQRKPRYGFTLGMGDILKSRQILLLVSGRHKRAVLKRLGEPRVTTALPASFLWLHGNAQVVCDRPAASLCI